MTIYKVHGAEGYDFLNSVVPRALRNIFHRHQGEPLSESWQPTEVLVEARNSGKGPRQLKRSDLFPAGLGRLSMTRAASQALADLLLPNGELLPLIANDGQALVLHNTRVLDCLDYDRSDLARFETDGRIMTIFEEVFRGDLIENCDIFRLPAGGRSAYVSERFVKAVEAHSLQGADFELCKVV